MKTIQQQNQSLPNGHYSPGIEHGRLIFVLNRLPMEYAVEAQKLLGLKLKGSVG